MSNGKKFSISFATILAVLAKGAKLTKFIKLFKVAKPVVLFVSMSVSAVAYTFMLGPWLAILFVGLLLVHEMGHVVAMKMKGFDTPTPVFIPFIGAAIFAPKFGERYTEAFVGYGGPLLGTIGTLLVFGLWLLIPKETSFAHVLLVGSYLGAYLNLFNLLPISPLDGGRITQAVGLWFKYIGLIALAVFSVFFREPVILYVWIIVLFELEIVPVRIRAVLVSVCWVAMVTLMSLGYGDQPVWVNVLDCVLTIFFVAFSIVKVVKNVDEEADVRPALPKKQSVKWLVLYLSLMFVLIVTLVLQVPYLPQPG